MRFESSIPQVASDFQSNDDFLVTCKTYTFLLSEQVFNSMKVDESKCVKYKRSQLQIKISLKLMQSIEQLSEYVDLMQSVLDYIEN